MWYPYDYLYKNRGTSKITVQHITLIFLIAVHCEFSAVSSLILHSGTVISLKIFKFGVLV